MTQARNEEFVEFGVVQYIQILKRRWLPASLTVLICTALSAFIAVSSNQSQYESRGKLLFQSRDPKDIPDVGFESPGINEAIGRNNPLQTQANLIIAGSLLEEVIRILDMKDSLGDPVAFDVVRQDLAVSQIPETDILEISYVSTNADFSADFVNVLMKSFLKFNAKTQKSNVEAAREFIRGELPKLKSDFEKASRALSTFKAQNGVLSLEAKANEVSVTNEETLQNSREISRRLESVSARAQSLRRELSKLRGQTNLDFIELSKLNDSAVVQKTLAELQDAQSQLKVVSEQLTPDHPNVIDLTLKVTSLENVLQQQSSSLLGKPYQIKPENLELSDLQKELVSELARADLELQSLREEEQLVTAQKSRLGTEISDFARLEKTQRDLEQNLESSRERYFQLLESMEKLDLTEVKIRESNQVQIIESAISAEVPLTSFNAKIVVAGALLGMSLAFGLALLLDILDSKVKSTDQLEKILDYPVFGIIPKHDFGQDGYETFEVNQLEAAEPQPSQVLISGDQFSPMYAAYQQIFVNLTLVGGETLPKALSVTSSAQQEGKSEIAANLAATIAQAGYQVLLVDASFRNPSQHRLWKLENNGGLSDILYKSERLNLLQQKVAPNLHVLTAGQTATNRSIISRYSEFIAFVDRVSKQYDCVIFDTGSLLGDPDTISAIRACEGTLLVASLEDRQTSEILDTKALLNQAKIPVLGLVINKAEGRDLSRSAGLFVTPENVIPVEQSEAFREELGAVNT